MNSSDSEICRQKLVTNLLSTEFLQTWGMSVGWLGGKVVMNYESEVMGAVYYKVFGYWLDGRGSILGGSEVFLLRRHRVPDFFWGPPSLFSRG